MSQSPEQPSSPGPAWAKYADKLAGHAQARFVNRTNRCGGYRQGKDGLETFTAPANGSEDGYLGHVRLRGHYAATSFAALVGVHALSPESAGKWVGIDIDAHPGMPANPDENLRFALAIYAELVRLGFRPLLESSNGKGGYHIWVLFDQDVVGRLLLAFGRWLVRDHARFGFEQGKPPEVFPKADQLTTGRKFGNWLRLPGRHHTREHWSEVYDGTTWLTGEAAVLHILSLTGDPPTLMPAEARTYTPPEKKAREAPSAGAGSDDDIFERFNRAQTMESVAAMLYRHGWKDAGWRGDRHDFRRPGKSSSKSGNLMIRDGVPIFYGFTSSSELAKDTGLNPSSLRAQLELRGNFRLLADKLRDEGYGPPRVKVKFNGKPITPDANPDPEPPADQAADAPPEPPADEPAAPPDAPAPDNRKWDDPSLLAEKFLRRHTLQYVKKNAFLYADGHYSSISDQWVEDALWALTQEEADLETARREAARVKALENEELSEAERKKKLKPVEALQVFAETVSRAGRAVRSTCRLPDPTMPDSWLTDTPPFAGTPLVVVNGILDLDTRTIHPHTADYFGLTALPVVYDALAPAPVRFLALIDQLLEADRDRIALLQEVFGSCLDPRLPWKHFTALTGSGDNGKTVVLNILRAMLGPGSYSAVNLVQLTNNRFATFPMMGKLANITGDEAALDLANEGKLKELTGGEIVAFEEKNKTPLYGPNTAKIIFGANTVPVFWDPTNATWNRLTIIPFRFVVPADKKDIDLLKPEYWSDELPGILNWSLEGLARYKANKRVTYSALSRDAVECHRTESDPARQFLAEHYMSATNGFAPSGVMYQKYKAWFDENGYDRGKLPLLNSNTFSKTIPSVFPTATSTVERIHSGGPPVRGWKGLAVIQSDSRSHVSDEGRKSGLL